MTADAVNGDDGFTDRKQQTLLDLVRDVVTAFAPEERPLLAALESLDEADAARRLTGVTKRDDPLGSGIGELVVLATPIVWTAVQEAAKRIGASAGEDAADHARTALRKRWGKRKPVAAAPLPEFGPAELEVIRARVLELAIQSGMKAPKAALLAEAVHGRLSHGGSESSTS